MQKIYFFEKEMKCPIMGKKKLREFLKNIFITEKINFKSLNIIFCKDDFLLSINKQFLNHDFLTDIITFNLSENLELIDGEIYISLERAQENALFYNNTFSKEVLRLIIHGILHLCGYKDKKKSDFILIRQKEEHYLKLSKSFT